MIHVLKGAPTMLETGIAAVNRATVVASSFMWRDDALTAMRSMQALDLNDFDVIQVQGHLWHAELSATQRSAMAAALRRGNIRIESLNLPALGQHLASVVPEAREYAVKLFTEVMTLGAELGARGVVAVPGQLGPDRQENARSGLIDLRVPALIVMNR